MRGIQGPTVSKFRWFHHAKDRIEPPCNDLNAEGNIVAKGALNSLCSPSFVRVNSSKGMGFEFTLSFKTYFLQLVACDRTRVCVR